MKIYYLVTDDANETCINHCPIKYKNRMVGSYACRNCKYCYGASKELGYSLFGKDNGDLELRKVSYVKCSAVLDYLPFKVKLQKFLYNIKKEIIMDE